MSGFACFHDNAMFNFSLSDLSLQKGDRLENSSLYHLNTEYTIELFERSIKF